MIRVAKRRAVRVSFLYWEVAGLVARDARNGQANADQPFAARPLVVELSQSPTVITHYPLATRHYWSGKRFLFPDY
jgi:hypothetical protein